MHSHDKKGTYEESNSESSLKLDESQANSFKSGRKDLPHTVETDAVTESRIREEENREVGGVERENKHEDAEDGGQGGGSNEIDERNREKMEEEADHEKEIADEEEKNKDRNGQVEEFDMLKDQEHEEVSREAREKNYEGDDASSAVVQNTQVKEHEERSREAQEMRFKGDDASSAVAHDAQVTEHEVGSYEQREKSFRDDDASSAVEQDFRVTESKSENGGSGSVDEKQLEKIGRKEIESETVTNGTMDGLKGNDSSTSRLDISNTHVSSAINEDGKATSNNYPTINSNAVEKRESYVGAYPKLEDGSSSSSTAEKSNNHPEQQANLPTVNAIGNGTELHMNSLNNEKELQKASSTMFSHKGESRMNSTSVSDQSESEFNMVIDTVTNGVPLQNESATLDSVQVQNAAVEMVTPSEHKLESMVMEQTENSNTTVRPEKSGGSSTTFSARNGDGETVSAEPGNSPHNVAAQDNGEAHTDQSTLEDIKTKAKSGGEKAAE
ncbi:protein FYV8 [Cocos nucifera]|nr:protein FYV8 [Cocos nucifera]